MALAIIQTAVILYCLVSVGILWAYSRTRLYPLYVLKTIWVSFTIICFLWIFAMSCADPGPKHGGTVAEFLRNPAGPLAALGDYGPSFRYLFFSNAWWMFFLAVLLLLWRGLSGNRLADEDDEKRFKLRRGFLLGSAILLLGLTLFLDHTPIVPRNVEVNQDEAGTRLTWRGVRGCSGYTILRKAGAEETFEEVAETGPALLEFEDAPPGKAMNYSYRVEARPGYIKYTGALLLAVCCAAWAFLPLDWRRRHSLKILAALGLILAVPLAGAFGHFKWGRYAFGFTNYAFAWKTARMGDYVTNSMLVSVLAVGVTTLFASMAAYALSRLDFKGRSAVLYGFLAAMVIPAQLYIVPLFLMVRGWEFQLGSVHFNFMDSRLGLSLIYAAGGLPFTIFLLTGFYRTLPTSLGESAAIDGCSEWRVFTDIYFPLATPGIATAAIFQFLRVWNEYQFALVFLTNDKLKTLPVGLYNLSVSQQYAANWPALFAGVTILCLPTFVIFILLQERIVAGLTLGAVKG